jgi:hypothetical protein
VEQGAGVRIDQRQSLGAPFAIDHRKPLVWVAAKARKVIRNRLWRDVAHARSSILRERRQRKMTL